MIKKRDFNNNNNNKRDRHYYCAGLSDPTWRSHSFPFLLFQIAYLHYPLVGEPVKTWNQKRTDLFFPIYDDINGIVWVNQRSKLHLHGNH